MGRNEVDGIIGPKSTEYIKSYQLKKGLTADGKVGNRTWAKMQSYLSSYSNPKNGKVIYNTHDALKVSKTCKHASSGVWYTYNRNGKGLKITRV